MGVQPTGPWEGLATHLPRRQRPLTDDRRAALDALLAKGQLDPYERGQLVALARDGSALDRDRAQAKLHPATAPAPTPAATTGKVNDRTIERWAGIIDKVLVADADRER